MKISRFLLRLGFVCFAGMIAAPMIQCQVTDTDPALILPGHTDEVRALAFSPDGTRLATVSRDGSGVVYNLATGASLFTINAGLNWFNGAAYSPDGQQLLTALSNGEIKAWNANTGQEIQTYAAHSASVTSLAFSADGSRFVSGSEDNTAIIWNTSTGAVVHTLVGHGSEVVSVDYSADGAKVVTGSFDNTAKIWNAQTGAELFTLAGHTDWVNSVAFSPDSAQVATGSFDNAAKLWNVADGAEIRAFSGHSDWIYAVDYSPTESKIITGARDLTSRIWNPATGELLRILQPAFASQWIISAAFSPDGQTVATGNNEGVTWVWTVNRDVPPTATPTLTPTQTPIPTSTPTPTITPTPIGPAPTPRPDGIVLTFPDAISVYDDTTKSQNLVGDTDFDAADNRQLVITWDVNDPNVVNWHVYAQVDIYGYFYIGQTGSGDVKELQWPGSALVDEKQKSGPAFGKTYRFRVYGLLSQPGFTVAAQSKPVAFTLEGSAASPVFSVPQATLADQTLLVTDDMFDTENLLGKADADDPSQRALFFRWNVGANEYWNYHIYASVNGGDSLFLGQTGAGDVNYFRWSDITLFDTTSAFIAGPQPGNQYQFTIFGLKGQGVDRLDASAPVTYQ